MEYDPDDPPPRITMLDVFWFYANRAAEHSMWAARLFGVNERRYVMVLHCSGPGCMNVAQYARKLQDPRRGHGEDIAYIRRHFCSFVCEEAAIEELERQSQCARLCN